MIIGITGSIGSGKTTVAKLFSKHWYNRIDADEIGHKLLKKNSVVYKKIINEFEHEILDKNKNIDRAKLGDTIFCNSKKLKTLNSIMHPLIINEIRNQIKKIKEKCGYKTKIVIDAPLLLQSNVKSLVDIILVVKSTKNDTLKRLNKKYLKQKIENILNAQMPLNEQLKYGDFIIENNKDLIHLENQVKNIIRKIFHAKRERFFSPHENCSIPRSF